MRANLTRPPTRLGLVLLLFVLGAACFLGIAAHRHRTLELEAFASAAQRSALRRMTARVSEDLHLAYALQDIELAARVAREVRRREPALEGLRVRFANGAETVVGSTRDTPWTSSTKIDSRRASAQALLLGSSALQAITQDVPVGELTVYARDPAEIADTTPAFDPVFPAVSAALLGAALLFALWTRRRLSTLANACQALTGRRFHEVPKSDANDEIGWALSALGDLRDMLAEQVDRVHDRNAELLREVTVYDDRLRRHAAFASSLVAPIAEQELPAHALTILARDAQASLALLLVPDAALGSPWRCAAVFGMNDPSDAQAQELVMSFAFPEHRPCESPHTLPPLSPEHPWMQLAKRRVPLRGVVAVPLRFRGRLEGLVVLAAKAPWTRGDLEFLGDVAHPFAIALANRKAYQASVDLSRALEARNDTLVRQKVELENMGRLRDQFVANVSHELRTPLNAILGYAELIGEGCYGPVTGEQEQAVRNILESSEHLLALVNQVLDLSRMEAGTLELRPDEVDLMAVADQVVRMASSLCRDRTYTPFVRGSSTTVVTDCERVQQILLNLLGNAIKFTHAGEVSIEVVRRDDGGAELRVRDTGIGIPPSHAEIIFEEFRQVDGSTTRDHDGAGLGLAISRRLARTLGGSLEVESEVGRGSTFTLSLPASVPSPSHGADKPANESANDALPHAAAS